ncbi:Odorant receptor 54 [Halyomorpha halys]|nr:Odorant receptor 54 [Halyomorpha halys]
MNQQAPITDSEAIEGLNIKYLKFFGLWKIINDYRITGKRNIMLKVQLVVGLMFTVPYVVFQYISFFFIDVDVEKMAFLTLHTLPGTQMCCEILLIYFRIDSECRLFNLIKKDFIYIPENKRDLAGRILTKIGKNSNILCIGVFLVNLITLIFAVNFPVASVDYILYHTGNMDAVTTGRKKIFGGWYPLPMDKTPYYEIIYFFEAAFHLWAGMLLAAYISLFYQVLMCLYAQFSILSLRLSSLKVEKENSQDINGDSKIYKELYMIIKEHKKLLSYSNELRSVYNPLVTMVLGIGIIILIASVFRSLFIFQFTYTVSTLMSRMME